MKLVAVVRVRGKSGLNKDIVDTMRMNRLFNKNHCTIYLSTPSVMGMLQKAKDYITWGEIDKETLILLLKSRGRLARNLPLTDDYLKQKIGMDLNAFAEELIAGKKSLNAVPGLKLFFRLRPPTMGFERGGIKVPFSMGGTLGYRKDDINNLLKRMI